MRILVIGYVNVGQRKTMKTIILLWAVFTCLVTVRAGEPEEEDFKRRLASIVEAADMVLVDTIYIRGDTPQKQALVTTNHVEAIIVRKIKKVTFADIFPKIKERLSTPIEIDGKKYLPNLPPYRMVTIEYEVPIKNGSAGYSALAGFQNGQLFIVGHKRVTE